MDQVLAPTTTPFGFPIHSTSWARLELDALIGELEGAPLSTRLRALAARANEARGPAGEGPISAGELLTFAAIHYCFRYVAHLHWAEDHPGLLDRAIAAAEATAGADLGEPCVREAMVQYPRLDGSTSPAALVEELATLSVSAMNPAIASFRELLNEAALRGSCDAYDALIAGLEEELAAGPPVREQEATIFALLREPFAAAPTSLSGQLDYIIERWSVLLPAWLLHTLLKAQDVLREERLHRGGGAGPNQVLVFGQGPGADDEVEGFTPDRDWMANVVLMAKSTFVWLDQLSRRYDRPIRRLDEIPDEELDRLARWGFTGLWLIGVWERSPASAEIKRRMGNPEALSSAYSLYDYQIAWDLGGEEAYRELARRAWTRGIRLAADMVPNHFGIYSKWVIEHPERFIRLDRPPFPGYRFTGPDLSRDGRCELRIEDGYWNQSDAAVVFERLDRGTGRRDYIYHGNDGTSTPWNDTAQLNYLDPAVREAVIEVILDVARRFPIIRFDAAMTLARRHVQRLWFPAPGEGGAIPSRAEHGLSHAEMRARMPVEFWREVVDRVRAEAPDTLLLAEAFWLMEGYFVRTLGMHRVYNSAFMNMLKMEENAAYRQTLRNVLEYSPPILQRFVNFMSNPDERTAVEQFGKGDKYLGCALLLVTMPGLPMFAHGQVEGLSEKYGMEYRRAYWDETPDEDLVERHRRLIFPLMRRRHLFSHVGVFALYDFVRGDGGLDANVFAYSNRAGDDRALVLYHNAYADTAGWARLSTPINVGSADEPHLKRRTLGDALGLREDDGVLYAFRDHMTGLEYLRTGRQLCQDGAYVELGAYGAHVFLDWREIHADEAWWAVLQRLQGRGTDSLDDLRWDVEVEPVTQAFNALLHALAGGRGVTAALGVFLDTAGVAQRDEVQAQLQRALAAPDRLAAASGASPELVGRLLAGPVSGLVPVLSLLRAIPEGAISRFRLAREVGRFLAAPAWEHLLPLVLDEPSGPRALVEAATEHLGVHTHGGVRWIVRERVEELIEAFRLSLATDLGMRPVTTARELTAAIAQCASFRARVEGSGYRFDELLEALPPSPGTTPATTAGPTPPARGATSAAGASDGAAATGPSDPSTSPSPGPSPGPSTAKDDEPDAPA